MDVTFIVAAEIPQLAKNRQAHAEWIDLMVVAGETHSIDAQAGYLLIAGQLPEGIEVVSVAGTAGISKGIQTHRHTGMVEVSNLNRVNLSVSFVKVSFR